MDAKTILKSLAANGISLNLREDGTLRAWPAANLTDAHRELIRSNREALHDFIVEAHALTAELVEAALAACELWGDTDEAMEQMRRDVLDTPPQDKADLLEYFKNYPSGICARSLRPSKG